MSTASPAGPRDSSTITRREAREIAQANASGSQPVVFVHGLWLLASSWDRWAGAYEAAGYAPLTPGWPDDPETVSDARAHPEAFAGKTVAQIVDHVEEVIGGLDRKPVIVGHSFGGLFAQMLAGRGLAAATVAISPAPFRGVLPLPLSALRSTFPVLANPANRRRAVSLTLAQFRYAFANTLDPDEAAELHGTFSVPAAGMPLFQAAAANLNPRTELKVDASNPERGPLLIVSGDDDNIVPRAIAHAAFKKQRRNEGVTEIAHIPDRGHSLAIDSRWRQVADRTLTFVERFAPSDITGRP